jgi:hypothetical protein
MGARKRLPDDAIIGAIQRWRGNVTAAADDLGLAPINLRKRLAGLGVDLPLLRRLKDTGIHGTYQNIPAPQTIPARPVRPMDQNGRDSRKHVAGGIFPRPAARTTFAPVGTEAMMTRPKQPTPIRLTPEQIDKLRDAKFELQYHLRSEVNESAILQQFFEDGFEVWLKARLQDQREKDEQEGHQ